VALVQAADDEDAAARLVGGRCGERDEEGGEGECGMHGVLRLWRCGVSKDTRGPATSANRRRPVDPCRARGGPVRRRGGSG
jgi:hypothetical protein